MYCQMDEVNRLLNALKDTENPKLWKILYKSCIMKFFTKYLSQEHLKDRKLRDLTVNEVDSFLDNLPYEHNTKANYYQALKKFFEFADKKGVIPLFYKRVKEYKHQRGVIKCIEPKHVKALEEFIEGESKLENRLLIGLLLYTGLSRKYIANLSFQQITDDMSCFRINNGDSIIPIRSELSDLLTEFRKRNKKKHSDKFFGGDETSINYMVGEICMNVCGRKYTPTEFSNTFIGKALGEESWKNLYPVSKMTLESISTISQHIHDTSWLIEEQRKILKMWK